MLLRTYLAIVPLALGLFCGPVICPAPVCAASEGDLAAGKGPKGKKVSHVVLKGETLAEIALQYGVTVKQILRWNPKSIKDADRVSVGTKLRVYARVPVRGMRRSYYVVKKGDNLRRIARKLKVDVTVLRSLNRIKGDTIHPGDKLAYLVAGPEKKSESVGRPYDGRLINGEKMPRGPGYTYGGRKNIYGTNETITLLIECLGKFIQKYPDGPLLVVGNLSQKNGGGFGPHASHQSGRDVDIGYIHKAKLQPVTSLRKTTPKNMDLRKTWFLLKTFLDTGKVQYMFINYELQKALYEHLQNRRFKQSYIDRIFQYPRRSGGGGIIQHSDGHDDHVHIRFVCPKGDKRCQD